jgi:hypothetical protein
MSDQKRASQTDPVEETPVEPIPPRFWWLKRILIVSGILLAGLVILRVWWGWDVHRRLQAEIDKYAAAGEPIHPEDFNPRELIPDDQNAAKLLLDAEVALNLTMDESALVSDLASQPAGVKEHLDEVGQIVTSNTPVFDLVREARHLAGKPVDWGVRVKSPALTMLLPSLSGQRVLGKLLSTTAIYQHTTHEDASAIETLCDSIALAEVLDAQSGVITHLFAIATVSVTMKGVEQLAPDLAIHAKDADVDGMSHPATVAQVRSLITILLNEEGLRNGFVRAMQVERMALLDLTQLVQRGDAGLALLAGSGAVAPAGWVERALWLPFGPIIGLDGLWMVKHVTAYVAAARKPTWPGAVAVAPSEAGGRSVLEWLKYPLSGFVVPSLSRVMTLHYRVIAMRRLAATALAIRLYEIDHGRCPVQLTDLVSDYLTEVPLDPFANDRRTIAYRPDARPPVLYSVNKDGVDDEGSFTLRSDGTVDNDELDLVFFLDGDRPRPARDEEEDAPPTSPDVQHEDRDAEDQDRNREKK